MERERDEGQLVDKIKTDEDTTSQEGGRKTEVMEGRREND